MAILIKVIYNLVIAVLLAILVGVGITVFYTAPSAPDSNPCPAIAQPVGSGSSMPCEANSQNQYAGYQSNLQHYQGVVSGISLLCTLLFIAIGILFYYRLESFSAGFLLG